MKITPSPTTLARAMKHIEKAVQQLPKPDMKKKESA